MNWTALIAILALAAFTAVVWLALAARLVANEERSKERAEIERRRLDMMREASEQERRQTAFQPGPEAPPPARRGSGAAEE